MTTNAGNIFHNFFKKNRTTLCVLSILYLLGVGIGAWIMKNMDGTQTTHIFELFENYISLFDEGSLGFYQIFYSYFISGFRYFTFIVILGFLVIGTPVLIGGILYKGFCTGFACACLLSIYGMESPAFLWVQILWQNILLMPCILLFSCQSLLFSVKTIRAIKRDKRLISFDFRREALIFIMQYIGFLVFLILLSLIGASINILIT